MSEADNPNQQLTRCDPNYDAVWRLRWLLDALNRRFPRHYVPQQQLSVDEVMVPYKGKAHFKQYIRMKPTRWGIKAWALCEAKSGYMLRFSIYTGRGKSVQHGLAHGVVTELITCSGLSHRGYHIYCDSYFSSPDLFMDLASSYGTMACGTVRLNRRGLPADIMSRHPQGLSKERGAAVFRQNVPLTASVWRDKRNVYLLSSIHDKTMSSVQRTVQDAAGHWSRQDVPAPASVVDYTAYMGGVDLADQCCQYYFNQRKTRTWYTKVFFYLLEVSKVNAFRLYLASRHPDTPANKRPSLLQFTLELVEELLGDHTSNTRIGRPSLAPLDTRLTSRCMPGTFPNRSWCHVCWSRVSRGIQEKRRQTQYGCLTCQKHLCLPECFALYHTERKY